MDNNRDMGFILKMAKNMPRPTLYKVLSTKIDDYFKTSGDTSEIESHIEMVCILIMAKFSLTHRTESAILSDMQELDFMHELKQELNKKQ